MKIQFIANKRNSFTPLALSALRSFMQSRVYRRVRCVGLSNACYILLLIAVTANSTAMEKSTNNLNLMLTTALINDPNGVREKEYIASFKQLQKLGYNQPYIVEGVQAHGPSFLEEYTIPKRVYYYPDNKPSDKNRGKFEGLSIKQALQEFEFPEKSYVAKQTGRYLATKDPARLTREYAGFDLYIRRFPGMERVVLAAFVMRAEKMKEMYEALDYQKMESEWSSSDPEKSWIENYITDYIKQTEQENRLSVCYLPSGADDFPLGIISNPEFSSTGATKLPNKY